MPEKTGRTGGPGNSTTYHPIGIATSNPGLLSPMGGGRGNLSMGKVFSGKVPGRSKGKFDIKSKGSRIKPKGY